MASNGFDGSDGSGSGSWFNRPARAFPARVWLEAHYGFRLPPARLTPAARPCGHRPFPAQVWLAARANRR